MSEEEKLEFNDIQLSIFLTKDEILKAYRKLQQENQQLKEIIDKAINYIDQIIQYDLTPFDYIKTDNQLNILIGILRGGKNE